MPSRTPASLEARKAQGRMASAVRVHGPDDPRTREARAAYRGESYLAAVAAAVADAPPLSPDQRDRLAVLLRPATELTKPGSARATADAA